MRKLVVLLAIAFVGPALPCVAAEGTNLASDYPDAQCGNGPPVPVKPSVEDQNSVADYNMKVGKYNIAEHSYMACINTYIQNANNDQHRIHDKVVGLQSQAAQTISGTPPSNVSNGTPADHKSSAIP